MNELQQHILRRWGVGLIAAGATIVFYAIVFVDAHITYYSPDWLSWLVIVLMGPLYFDFESRLLLQSRGVRQGAIRLLADWLIMFVAIWIGMSIAWGAGFFGFLILGTAFGVARLLANFFATKPQNLKDEHLRGAKLTSTNNAEKPTYGSTSLWQRLFGKPLPAVSASKQEAGQNRSSVIWTGIRVPDSVAPGNFVVVGAQGTGKTLMHRELMGSLVARAQRRLLIYDLKRDLMSQLLAWGVDEKDVILLNPFDARAKAWDVAADMCDSLSTDDYAKAFVPTDPDEPQKYFTRAAQDVLAGVLKVLIRNAPGKWTLRDLVLITADVELLRAVLNLDPEAALVIKKHFEPADTFGNVRSQLGTFIGPLANVAAIWEAVPSNDRVRLAEWARSGDKILVMGTAFRNRETVESINRVMFNFIANELTSGEELVGQNRTWVFIDELKEAQRLDGISQLLSNGRSKGIRLVLGFQDLEGLKARYGESIANEILGLCHNQTFLFTSSPKTAEFACKRIGQKEVKRRRPVPRHPSESEDEVPHGDEIVITPAVLESEIMGLPVSINGVVEGFHIIPAHPDKTMQLRGDFKQYPFHKDLNGDNFKERTRLGSIQLRPWSTDDVQRLGLVIPRRFGLKDLGLEPSWEAGSQPNKSATQSDLDSFGRLEA